MKNTIKTLLTAIAVLTLSLVATNAMAYSERESLAASEHVTSLYTVDETHSFIIGTAEATFGHRVVTKYTIEGSDGDAAYMIEHRSPQPIAYKGAAELESINETATLAVEELGGSTTLTGLGVFEKATFECAANGGTVGYVVPRVYGNYKRLTRVGAVEAFDYILLKGDKGGAWYIGCENADTRSGNFLVTKTYSFLTGYRETAAITYGRTLNGVNCEESIDTARTSIARVMALKGDAPVMAEGEFLEKMARRIADMQLEIIMPNDGSRYLGSYRTASKMGCDDVTIKHLRKRVIEKNSVAKVYEFRVCADEVALLSETAIEDTEDTTRTIFASYETTYLASVER